MEKTLPNHRSQLHTKPTQFAVPSLVGSAKTHVVRKGRSSQGLSLVVNDCIVHLSKICLHTFCSFFSLFFSLSEEFGLSVGTILYKSVSYILQSAM